MSSDAFTNTISALDEVVGTFLNVRRKLPLPTTYESDAAAFQLMEGVFRHVNAVSAIAMMPTPGSHLVSAWVLLRAAFEAGLTAHWLTLDDDWKEREARWLGWVKADEDFHVGVSRDFSMSSPEYSGRLLAIARQLEETRLAITAQLPKDSRIKRPKIHEMIKECGIEEKKYIIYRVGSQATHGTPTLCRDLFEMTEQGTSLRPVRLSHWQQPLLIASWCMTEPGRTTLRRAGATPSDLNSIVDAHDRLIEQAEKLNQMD